MAEQLQGIRWGRALGGAILVEIGLALVALAVDYLTTQSEAALNLVVPPASFIVPFLVALWLFARAAKPVANGAAIGLACLALYVVLIGGAYLVAPEKVNFAQMLGPAYIASHILKIVGGAAGGWWIARKRTSLA